MDFHIEMVNLKKELLKKIIDLDTKFSDLFSKKKEDIPEEVLSPLSKINLMLNKTEQMFNSINEQQIKLDKITDLEAFKNKVNDMVLSHEIRINSLAKDLDDTKFKYDREISKNLTVPGYIGASCRFKTISEYLLFNIDDINKLKLEKDLMKKDDKDLKTKIDSMLKNTLILVDNSVKRSNSYTDNKQKDFEDLLNSKYKEFNDKIMDIKTSSISTENLFKSEIIKLTKLGSELNYIKDNVDKVFDSKSNEIKTNINELKNKIEKINNEVRKNHKNLDNINNFIKNLNNSENINFSDKSKLKTNSNKTTRKTDNNYNNNIRRNKFNKTKKEEQSYMNEYSNSINKRDNNSFKQITSREKINKYNNIYQGENSNSKENQDYYNYNKFSNKKKDNDKLNQLIKQKNQKISKETKEDISSKYLTKNDNKYINNKNITNKFIKNSIDGNYNINSKSNEKTLDINKKFNFSDDEKEKKTLISFDKTRNHKNRNNIENKLNKYKYINIDTQKNDEKYNNENFDNHIMTYTDYNFYNRNSLNDLHIYKNDINNLKRFPIHKRQNRITHNYGKDVLVQKYETSEESSKRGNSDVKNDINLNNSSNQLVTQKINNIYFPNEQMIKKFKNKDYLFKQFLIRHNNNSKKKYGTKSPEQLTYEDNNTMNEAINNYNEYNASMDKTNIPPLLIKDSEYLGNRKSIEIQTNRNLRNDQFSDKVNFKFISIDNQFKIALKKRKYHFRNNPELILSTPITNVFKTFQMKKNREMINNNYKNN